MPDQSGRVAVITGANSGLGLETARALVAKGAHVVMAVRSLERGQEAADDIKRDVPDAQLEVQQLDLASLESIRAAAAHVVNAHDRIDLLINNAGVMYTPQQKTADGFEMQFGTNHLGHFAWTGLLLNRLVGTDGSRVVTVSSVGHKIRSRIDFDDLQSEKSYDRVVAYGRSKLSNLLFTYELQRRLSNAGAPTQALAAHPGVSDTELGRHIPGAKLLRPVVGLMLQGPDMGALPTLRAAVDPQATGGQYYGPGGFMEVRGHPVVVESNADSHDQETQQRLWAVSAELTEVTYPV
ncbi:MAG: SDR family NAD(P)-dependent oxidoreductase [Acidimicrobiales bacterium]|nr:SDR family NAD(P)-dependent oxidoreductase [Acidimicrobiales bacterium]